jgi:predicted nucleotidyltransferase
VVAGTERGLPEAVERGLEAFVAAAVEALGDTLRAVVLYGSAAWGRLRATSDVNLILVLSRFDLERVDRLREPLRIAGAAIRLAPMLVLEAELPALVEAFPEKVADVLRRRRVLVGRDPFDGAAVAPAALAARLRQVLLNLTLRLRERYVSRSLREEQAARIVAEAAGPLRSAAATLLALEGTHADSPRAALEQVAASLGDPGWTDVLAAMSRAREGGRLPPGTAAPALARLADLAGRLHDRARALGGGGT